MKHTWLLSLSLIFGTVILCTSKHEKRQTSTCSVETFNCSSGACIDSSLACDGNADCPDGSDETENLCTRLITTCPSYAFRCKYGACVDKKSKCNGKNDCVDGSDENLPECKGNVQQQTNGSKCQLDEYNCKSGQCIDDTLVCDGVRNCNDGSDETFLLCKTIRCPAYSFKCKYGACISKTSRCDGVKHCFDGSDEECITTTSKPLTPTKTTKPPPTKPTSPTLPSKKKTCKVPNSEGSIYSFNNTNQEVILAPGALVDQYLIVEESCETGFFKVDSYRYLICTETGQWEPMVTERLCLRMCPPMTSDSLDLKCIYKGEFFDCANPSRPGTKLRPSCKVTHSLPNGQIETPIELNCLPDGNWSGQLYTCVPYCGRLFTSSEVLITNGNRAKYGTAPWNVGIYRSNGNGTYDMICGGTLIAPNLVVSAAHCFWQEGLTDRILMNENQYKVAVGKYDRNISIKDNDFTQIIDVGLIFIENDYFGSSGFHANDIAIIVLSVKAKISNVVLPVCIDWTRKFVVQSGSIGKLVGWGKTEKMVPSPFLLEASLPYIDNNSCRKMYSNGFEVFVTSDKFCAGSQLAIDIDIRFSFPDTSTSRYRPGQGAHEGDSGAGLTFVHNDLQFLTGVVSVKDPNSNDAIAVFTDVSHHTTWISNIYSNFTSTPKI